MIVRWLARRAYATGRLGDIFEEMIEAVVNSDNDRAHALREVENAFARGHMQHLKKNAFRQGRGS